MLEFVNLSGITKITQRLFISIKTVAEIDTGGIISKPTDLSNRGDILLRPKRKCTYYGCHYFDQH
ncbi:hypothetical protein KHA80_22335 [Anaerobacillus sp. HL2]|nr:hypothetical protein KHA80_22335 [Anaerobacillus sp. HL2]